MKPVCLIGPTASGKSSLALALADRINGEIISVDSMQVYRGMDLGTAKPSREERERTAHHLIDLVNVREPYDAARFVRDADAALLGIRERGRKPIFCGGTGLYLKAWLEGLGESPSSDAALRAELEATPLEELLAELRIKDPETHDRIDRLNPRRVVRAMEVIRLTGKPFSAQRAAWRKGETRPARVIGLRRDPEDLRHRIDERVDQMFAAGLVAEVEILVSEGLEENRSAAQAIGYRQVIEHLRGERGLHETTELVKTRTWQFARRQMTWIRNQLTVEWVEVERSADMEELAGKILEPLMNADER
jgi:tRNA dimethylallyltransferase